MPSPPVTLTMDDLRRIPNVKEDDLHSQQMYQCDCCGRIDRHIFNCRGVRRVLYVELKPL